MVPDEVVALLREPRLAALGTVRRDGSPHQVPVKSMLVGDEVLVLTRRTTVKVRNLAAHPRASVCEHTSTRWATLEGPAYVVDDEASLTRARAAYLHRFGREDTWGDCVLVIKVDRVLTGT
jgi:PPOX class probable F420-dependent enzyme